MNSLSILLRSASVAIGSVLLLLVFLTSLVWLLAATARFSEHNPRRLLVYVGIASAFVLILIIGGPLAVLAGVCGVVWIAYLLISQSLTMLQSRPSHIVRIFAFVALPFLLFFIGCPSFNDFKYVKPGMSEADVIAVLGNPYHKQVVNDNKPYYCTWSAFLTGTLVVEFSDDGRVTSAFTE